MIALRTLSFATFVLTLAACGGKTDSTLGATTGGGGVSGSSSSGGGSGTGGAGLCPAPAPTCKACDFAPTTATCGPTGWECPMILDCPPPALPPCQSPTDCPQGWFCKVGAETCPTPANLGHCQPTPSACDDLYSPHCGCFTGKLYGNDCLANAAGEPSVACGTGGGSGTGGSSATGGSAATGGGSSTGGAGGGPSSTCGGFAGIKCPPGLYCEFSDKMCGGNDNLGTCLPPPPDKCGGDGQVCGCDGKVYPNTCAAELAGVDVSLQGFCKQPPGTFACGTHFCQLADEYCEVDSSDVGGYANGYACHKAPAICMGAVPHCSCLMGVPCGTLCKQSATGGVEVTCPGG